MENESPSRKSFLKALQKRKSAGDFDQMIVSAKNALKYFPENRKFKKMLHYAQAHYVNQKLNSSIVKDLEKNKDFNSLSKVYTTLLSVFPESKHLKKLLKTVKYKIINAEILERENYYKEAKKNIVKLYTEKNYDEALQACYQILSYNSEQKEFQKLLKKIERANKKVIDRELNKYLNKTIPELKKEFHSNKKAFIHV